MAVGPASILFRAVFSSRTATSAARSFGQVLNPGLVRSAGAVGTAMTLMGTAIIAALGASIREAAKLQTELARLETVSDFTSSQMASLRQEIQGLAIALGVPQADVARNLFRIVTSGITDAALAQRTLAVSTALARAGFANQEETALSVTRILNSYNLQTERSVELVGDLVFQTQRFGAITVEEVARGIGRVTNIAALAKVPLAELLGAVQLLSRTLKPNEVFTSIRQALVAILNPTDEAAKTLKALGLNLNGAVLAAKGLPAVMRDIAVATQGNADAIQEIFGNIRAFQGVAQIASEQGLQRLEDLTSYSTKAAGAVKRGVEEIAPTLAVQLDRAKEIVRNELIAIGEEFLPSLTPGVVAVSRVIATFIRNFVSVARLAVAALRKLADAAKEQFKRAVEGFKEIPIVVVIDKFRKAAETISTFQTGGLPESLKATFQGVVAELGGVAKALLDFHGKAVPITDDLGAMETSTAGVKREVEATHREFNVLGGTVEKLRGLLDKLGEGIDFSGELERARKELEKPLKVRGPDRILGVLGSLTGSSVISLGETFNRQLAEFERTALFGDSQERLKTAIRERFTSAVQGALTDATPQAVIVDLLRKAYSEAGTEAERAFVEKLFPSLVDKTKEVGRQFTSVFITAFDIIYAGGENLAQSLRDLFIRNIVASLFGTLFNLLPGGGFLGVVGGLLSGQPLNRTIQQRGIAVNFSVGAETMAEVIVNNRVARRVVYRGGVLPEARLYGLRGAEA